jgi:hydrogenase maturation factor
MNERYCQAEHCITCSDEAREVRVLQIDQGQATALVELDSTTDEVDISLVEHVIPGDLLLVNGGVAIARIEEGIHE